MFWGPFPPSPPKANWHFRQVQACWGLNPLTGGVCANSRWVVGVGMNYVSEFKRGVFGGLGAEKNEVLKMPSGVTYKE